MNIKCNIKPTRFQMQFLGILHRIIKSCIFNVAMIIIGFIVGFINASLYMHYNAIANSNYEFIVKIEHEVHELKRLDAQYIQKQQNILEQLRLFKQKISHDQANIDKLLRLNVPTNTIDYTENNKTLLR